MNVGKQLLAVGIGGTIGATGRYGVSLIFANWSDFPYAALIVNLIGCFFLTWLFNNKRIKEWLSQTVFTALGTGVIGSFTTFSTFAIETVDLLQVNIFLALIYIFINVFGGLLFCYLGFKIATKRQVVQS